jgi:hypothetical protein
MTGRSQAFIPHSISSLKAFEFEVTELNIKIMFFELFSLYRTGTY